MWLMHLFLSPVLTLLAVEVVDDVVVLQKHVYEAADSTYDKNAVDDYEFSCHVCSLVSIEQL